MNNAINSEQKEKDITGTIKYQIIKLIEEIKKLGEHLLKNKTEKTKGNQKDIPAKRALVKKVSKTRTLMNYLEKNNKSVFDECIPLIPFNVHLKKISKKTNKKI